MYCQHLKKFDFFLDYPIKHTMADQQQFFLKWNDFQSNMVSSFRHLRDEKSFTDVTLACEGQTCKAHKMVLSACSPYFKSLLEVSCPYKHNSCRVKHVFFLGKPFKTPNNYIKRCGLQPPSSNIRIYVRRRGEC